MDIKTQLKIFLAMRHLTVAELARKLSEVTGKSYTSAMIYGKLNRDTISFSECQMIAKILGYEIIFKEIK